MHPDGTPIVRWEGIDAALRQAGEAGEEVIFDVQCPVALSPEGWRALSEAVLRRYHDNPPAPVARWEAALTSSQTLTRYEAFARLARSLYPDTPVGLNLIADEEVPVGKPAQKSARSDVAEDIRHVAQVCAQHKVPLDSFAWGLADTPPQAAQQVEHIRRALTAFPTLKNVILLPTLPAAVADVASEEVNSATLLPFARPIAYVAHLLGGVAVSPPNALVGALLQEPLPLLPYQSRKSGDIPTPPNAALTTNSELAQGAFTLLNRMAGTRLRAQSDDSGIGCVATRSQSHRFVLLWREPTSASSLAARDAVHPLRFGESDNALIVVRLHHLGLDNSDGVRVTQTDLAQANADVLHPVSASMPTLTAASFPENAGSAEVHSILPPTGIADTFWSGKGTATPPPDDVEAPVLLAPGSVCLLEIVLLKTKPPLAAALTIKAGNAGDATNIHGGDTLKALLTVRNLLPRPQNLELMLDSSFRDLLPQGTARLTPGTLPANGGRAFQFTIHAPILSANANLTLHARINDTHMSLTFPVQAPLLAALESSRTDVESGTGRANTRVRLTNRSRVPLTVHLQAGEKTGTSVQVPPDGKPVMTALAVSPESREAGLYSVPLRVESGGRVLQTLKPVIGVPVLCPYAVVKPTIDGDLKEWAGSVPLGMGQVEQARGKAWGGPSDISGYAYAQWDEQFLYFACAVTDDSFTPPTGTNNLLHGDCILFALATPPRAHPPSASFPYAKFGMAITRNGMSASAPVLVRLTPDPKTPGKEIATAVKNAHFAIRREEGRTFYEAAIPWRELLSGPASTASPVSLSILLNDVDGRAQGAMAWGNGLYGTLNPLLFPPLRLVKSPMP